MNTTLYFATHNAHKLEEIRQMLPAGYTLLGLSELGLHEDIPETADTIEGNSAMKTRYVYEKHRVACFGDDTGLEVAALGNEPGVYSARYAGAQRDSKANMDLVLAKLQGAADRSAQFKTVITFIDEAGKEYQFTGIVKGQITTQLSGSAGFGYDPIFQPEGYDTTFAEMSSEVKNGISHRGRAFRAFIQFLKDKDLNA